MGRNPASEPRVSSPNPPSVVEIVGLSGIGKSAACRELLAREPTARRSWISIHERNLRISIVPRLLLPIVWLRYRRVLRLLPQEDGMPWFRLRTGFAFLKHRAIRLWRSKNPVVTMLFLLSTMVTELGLARLEARIRGRTLVVDEGKLHRALGVWVRSPASVRNLAVSAYLESLPSGSACLFLRGDPELARERAIARERGVPLPMKRAAKAMHPAGSSAEALSAVYREQAGIFDSESVRARIDLRDVDALGTPAEIAGRISEALRGLGIDRPLLIFLRD